MNAKKPGFEEVEKGIYVINDHYEIVYMDDTARQTFPDCHEHSICYRCMRGNDAPCFDCPLQNGLGIKNELLYNRKLQCWMENIVLPIQWPTEGSCVLVSMRTILKDTEQLHKLETNVVYDALFEFQLGNGCFTSLYYDKDKFPYVKQKGNLRRMLDILCEALVYEDDRMAFLQFWDLSSMKMRMDKKGYLHESFRIRIGKDYRWMKFNITPKEKGEKDTFVCFMDSFHQHSAVSEEVFFEEKECDELTGLYKKGTFEKKAKEYLRQHSDQKFALIDFDIEHFKLFNDWYGVEEGDHLLIYISYQIQKKVDEWGGLATRIGGDEFIFMLPKEACQVKELEQEIIGWIQDYDAAIKFLPTVGIYLIEDVSLPVSQMCDCAAMAASSMKGNYANRVAVYAESMKKKIENRQEILFGVKDGLQLHEFVVYYQPQCSARTKRVLGAEALVRWQHPKKGLLAPGEFIPILEQSGFIYKLDYYVWEEVCRFLQRRIANHQNVIPISVNVSRVDIFQFHLCDVFTSLIEQYQIPAHLLEIEITESAYAENFEQLIDTVRGLRERGFTVLMDDFGSGYSSLNMLSHVEMDILKIDMKFLDYNQQQSGKSSGILESVTSMCKWMGLRMIAEGVETREQSDRLLMLDCEYMQGYYFYRPMSEAAFCAILDDDERVDTRGMLAKRLPSINLEDLFHKDITSEAMLSNILGGIALYEVVDDHLRILMVNDRYYRITGCNAVDLQERSNFIINQVYPDDLPTVWNIFQRSEEAGVQGASGIFRRYRLSGELMWMHMQAFFLHKQGKRKLFYGAIDDVTATMSLQRELLAILQTMPGDIFEYQVHEDGTWSCRVISIGLTSTHGYVKYDFEKALKQKWENIVDERDRERVLTILAHPKQWGSDVSLEYRLRTQDKKTIWVEQHIRYISSENGVHTYNSLLTDISKIKNQEEELVKSQQLVHQMFGIGKQEDSTNAWIQRNQEYAAYLFSQNFTGGMLGCFCEEGFPLYFANMQFVNFLGYDTYEDLYQAVKGSALALVYEEDRDHVLADIGDMTKEGAEYETRFRLVGKHHNGIWVLNRGRIVREEDGTLVIISFCIDIDEIMRMKHQLQEVEEKQKALELELPSAYFQFYDQKDYPLRYVSRQFLEILGYDEKQLQQRFLNQCLRMVVAEDRSDLESMLQDLQDDTYLLSKNCRFYTSHGIVQVSLQIRRITHEAEEYFTAVLQDISHVAKLEQRVENIMDHTPADVFRFRNDSIYFYSHHMADVFAYSQSEYKQMLKETGGKEICHPLDYPRVEKEVLAHIQKHQEIDIMFRAYTKDKRICYLHMKASYSPQDDAYYGLMIDATSGKKQERALMISQRCMDSVIQQAHLDIWEYDVLKDCLMIYKEGGIQGEILPFASKIGENGTLITSFLKKLEDKHQFTQEMYHVLSMLKEHIATEKLISVLDLSSFHSDMYWIRITSERIYDDDQKMVKVIGYFQDITEEKRQAIVNQEEKKHSQYDSLTGVYNRRMGKILIENCLLHADGKIQCLCVLDLDDFKNINDTYGHVQGDRVLQEVVKAIASQLNERDIICRLGGDEFMVFTAADSLQEVKDKMEKILHAVYSLSSKGELLIEKPLTLSAGLALHTKPDEIFADLYERADEALYQVKHKTKGTYRFYDENIHTILESEEG